FLETEVAGNAEDAFYDIGGSEIALEALGQQLSSNVQVREILIEEQEALHIALTEARVALADEVLLQEATGDFVIMDSGLVASAAGSLAISLSDVSASGDFDFEVNTTRQSFDQELEVGDATRQLTWESGPLVRIRGERSEAGVDPQLTLAGQEINGSFFFERSADGAVTIQTAGVEASLGGASSLITLTQGEQNGFIRLSSEGAAVSIGGSLEITDPTNIAVSGLFALEVNTTGSSVSETFTVGGDEQSIELDGETTIRMVGTGVVMNILGQEVSGNFTIEEEVTADEETGNETITVVGAVSDMAVSFGSDDLALLELENGSGLMRVTSSGTALEANGTVTVNLASLGAEGDFRVAVNTSNDFFRLEGTDASLSIAGQTLAGNFALEENAEGEIQVAVSEGSLSFGDGVTEFVRFENGEGALLIRDD
ncbi:MAG: hypothetical protein MK312_10430, partial [Roseibacillus sp.]|nr:hypothetical protein [Roseibacillus sp.]